MFKQANKILVVTTPKHFNPVDLSQISDHSDLLYHLSFPNFFTCIPQAFFFNPKAFIYSIFHHLAIVLMPSSQDHSLTMIIIYS